MIPTEILENLTEKEQKQLLKDLVKGRDDEIFFYKRFLGITVHPGQKLWLQNAHEVVNILGCGNKWGKSVITGCRHIHKNFYKIGASGSNEDVSAMEYKTLAISPMKGQVKRTQQYMFDILHSKFSWHDEKENIRKVNKCSIGWFFTRQARNEGAGLFFVNGTQTDFRSTGDDGGDKLQGDDWYYISYDEYSRSSKLEAEMDGNLLPRLINYGGTLDLIGTPDKDSKSLQYVYDLFEDAQQEDSDYYFQGGSMFENKYVSDDNRQKVLKGIRDPETLKQVMNGEIIFSGGRMFNNEQIHKLWIPDVEWKSEEEYDLKKYVPNDHILTDDIIGSIFRLPELRDGVPVGSYIIAVDWHLADGGDETVMYVFRYDVEPFTMCYYLMTKRGDPYIKHAKIRDLHKIYNNASLVVDSQGVGRQLQYDLEDLQPTCFDSVSLGKEKKTMLQILKNYVGYRDEEGELTGKFRMPYTKSLAKQLGVYKYEDDKKLKQDHVMTLGIVAWWLENQGFAVDKPEEKRY